MKYSSYIDNVTSKKWGLNLQQAYLFDWIYSLPSWAERVFYDNDVYSFASRSKAIEELPILTDKTDTIYRYYKQLEELDLIVLKKIDGKDCVKLTEKGKEWGISLGKKSEWSEKNPNELGKKSEKHSDLNPTYKYTNTDKITIDNSEDEIFICFNQVLKKHIPTANEVKKTEQRIKNIRGRLRDGYKAEDFKKVFEFKFKQWMGGDYQQYLTIDTLTRPANFSKYLDEVQMKTQTKVVSGVGGFKSPFEKREIHN